MDLRYSRKTKSPTFVELSADRGHPGPNVLKLIAGSAFETFVDSLPRVKNGSNIYDVYHIYIT